MARLVRVTSIRLMRRYSMGTSLKHRTGALVYKLLFFCRS